MLAAVLSLFDCSVSNVVDIVVYFLPKSYYTRRCTGGQKQRWADREKKRWGGRGRRFID